MTAELISTAEAGTPEWHEARTNGIGGSEVAAIVGLSPWVSPFALFHRKTGAIGDQETSPSMDWGTRLEPVIIDKFAEEHPEFVLAKAGTYANTERPWQLANVDRLIHRDGDPFPDNAPTGILEVKTAGSHASHEWGKSGTDEIPPYYKAQVLWYGDCLGLPTAYVAVLIGGQDYREYVIDLTTADNQAQAAWLRNAAGEFWANVQANNPPPLDGADATYDAVRELHPEIDGTTIELDEGLWRAYEAAKLDLTSATEAHNLRRSELTAAMGTAHYGEVNGERVCRRQSTKGGLPYVVPVPKRKSATSEETAA